MTYITENTDAPENTTTPYTMSVGDFFIGTASSTNSTYNDDWVGIQLTAGTTYTVSLNSLGLFAAGLNNPFLYVYNSAGTPIFADDDNGPGNYSQISFTASYTGTYYLDAGASGYNDFGQYIMTVTAGSHASFDSLMGAAALYEPETSWSATAHTAVNVTFAIAGTGSAFDAQGNAVAFEVLTAAQTQAAQQALALYADVCGVSFTQVNSGGTSQNATILFNAYTSTTDGAGAYAYYPGSTAPGAIDGNVSLNNDSISQTNLPYGSYDFFAIMHEIGHAVGLAHPGDYNAAPGVNITYAGYAQFLQDTQQYSVMSYFDESNTGADFGGYADTLMMYDIAALQELYGVNNATRAGNTVYGFNSNAGNVYNFAINTDPGICIWDGAGTDTIDLSGWSMAQTLNLAGGTFSSVGGLISNLSIALGAMIENAIGGSGSDTMTGNSLANIVTGGGGIDTIFGKQGDDTLYGNQGDDTLRGNLGNDVLYGNQGVDYLYGGQGDDQLRGGQGNDFLYGNSGSDNLWGGVGSDVIDGGNDSGVDTAWYAGASNGYLISSSAPGSFSVYEISTGDTDTLMNIEHLIFNNVYYI